MSLGPHGSVPPKLPAAQNLTVHAPQLGSEPGAPDDFLEFHDWFASAGFGSR